MSIYNVVSLGWPCITPKYWWHGFDETYRTRMSIFEAIFDVDFHFNSDPGRNYRWWYIEWFLVSIFIITDDKISHEFLKILTQSSFYKKMNSAIFVLKRMRYEIVLLWIGRKSPFLVFEFFPGLECLSFFRETSDFRPGKPWQTEHR